MMNGTMQAALDVLKPLHPKIGEDPVVRGTLCLLLQGRSDGRVELVVHREGGEWHVQLYDEAGPLGGPESVRCVSDLPDLVARFIRAWEETK